MLSWIIVIYKVQLILISKNFQGDFVAGDKKRICVIFHSGCILYLILSLSFKLFIKNKNATEMRKNM